MYHPDTELRFINNQIGYGVFATKPIPKGSIVFALDPLDIIMNERQFNDLPEVIQKSCKKYCYIDSSGNQVLCWDISRYINHCCYPNTLSAAYGFSIAIVDIQAGDHITEDYGAFNLDEDFEVMCGKQDCRKIIKKSDLEKLSKDWDEKLISALESSKNVPQPLYDLLDEKTIKNLEKFYQDKSNYISSAKLKVSVV